MAFFDTCQGEDGFQMHFPSPLDPFKKQKTRDGPPDIRHGYLGGTLRLGYPGVTLRKIVVGVPGGTLTGVTLTILDF